MLGSESQSKAVQVTAAPSKVIDALTQDYPGLSIGKDQLAYYYLAPVLSCSCVWSGSGALQVSGAAFKLAHQAVSATAMHKNARPCIVWNVAHALLHLSSAVGLGVPLSKSRLASDIATWALQDVLLHSC